MLLRLFVLAFLLVAAAMPCSIVSIAQPWSKPRGSKSKLFPFQRDGRVGLIDNKGRVVVSPRLDIGMDDDEGRSRVMEPIPSWSVYRAPAKPRDPNRPQLFFNGLVGFADRDGKTVIPAAYADAGPFVDGLARVVLDGECALVWRYSTSGTPTTGIELGVSCSGGSTPLRDAKPCGTGFIDPTGGFAIPPRFESAEDFQEGLAAVRSNGKWGFIDRMGAFAVVPQYQMVSSFSEGLAAVQIQNKWGFIDKRGKLIAPPWYDAVEDFSDSFALATRGEQTEYLNRKGSVQITGKFRFASSFVNGLATIMTKEPEVSYINHQGQRVFTYKWNR